jgi:hypothetical protein
MVRLTGVPLDAKPLSQRLAGSVGVRLGDQDFTGRERICELFVDGGEVPARKKSKDQREIGGKHLGLIANRFEPSEFMGLLAMPTLRIRKKQRFFFPHNCQRSSPRICIQPSESELMLTQGAKNSTRAGFPVPTSVSKLSPSRSTTLLAVTERARVTSGKRIEGRRILSSLSLLVDACRQKSR